MYITRLSADPRCGKRRKTTVMRQEIVVTPIFKTNEAHGKSRHPDISGTAK